MAAAPAGAETSRVRDSVPLPVDFHPEGVTVGPGSTFYVGSLTSGDIFRCDLRTGRAASSSTGGRGSTRRSA